MFSLDVAPRVGELHGRQALNHLRDRNAAGGFSRRLAAFATIPMMLLAGCADSAPPATSRSPATSASRTASQLPAPLPNSLQPGTIGLNAVTLILPATRTQQYDYLKAEGFPAVRLAIEWDLIERSPGEFDWRETDSLINGAVRRGLKILGLLTYAPSWAVPPQSRPLVHPGPADAKAWRNFVAHAAQRYRDVVHNWEIWNEPNVDDSFAPAPDLAVYSAMLKESYSAIKAVDRDSVVITGGTSPAVDTPTEMSPLTFIKGLYDHGVGDSFDAVGMHPYSSPELLSTEGAAETSNSNRAIKDVTELMAFHGQSGKRIWFTEFGASTAAPGGTAPDLSGQQVGVTLDRQADILTDGINYVRSLSNGGPIFLFDHRDIETGSRNVEFNYGLLRSDFTAKPSLAAVQALLRIR
ncbi:cellulase family glycosylhydrolase [Mycobacterium sp. 21AC1]|uniref:cellulase family glycosylhydrolase n=1 Tax=[Mycobacterium] appelbergii TaxID=2939269 RepID=UPI002938F4D9|nr:cellulase family glycosylhydrolase [Mycobacterium sp. 21AC1]MDV3128666.1 cellulase family glycosylhydrolase [Mycobacterium sp. 21AC1]